MEDLSDYDEIEKRLVERVYTEGPQTENDFEKADFNYKTIKKRLNRLVEDGVLRRDPRGSFDKPGSPQPYHLTALGERVAAEALARDSGKLIPPPREIINSFTQLMAYEPAIIGDLTLPLTGHYGRKIVRDSLRLSKRRRLSDAELHQLFARTLSGARILMSPAFECLPSLPALSAVSMPRMPSMPPPCPSLSEGQRMIHAAVAVKDVSIARIPMDPIDLGPEPVLPRLLAAGEAHRVTGPDLTDLVNYVKQNTVAVVAEVGTSSATIVRVVSRLRELNVDPSSVCILCDRTSLNS
jgi:hypothetical protein